MLVPALVPALFASAFTVRYDASKFVNAAYNVSCLTGRLQCSRAGYTRFWDETMRATPEDKVHSLGPQFHASGVP